MQFIDLKAQYAALKEEINANIQAVLDSAQFIGGPQVKELEKELADFVGRKHCITCANGTDALQIAYMVAGVGEGDAVFCPDMTFISSTEPAKMFGATSVFCDITKDTYTLCPESLEKQIKAVLAEGKLTPKAVVAVDILGNPCDYDTIAPICEKYGLILIEDAAQAFGASNKGRKCCSFGYIATTSFFPAKPLGCYGDGDEREALQQRVAEENISNVVFKGRVEKKYVRYITSCADLNIAHNTPSSLFRFGISFNKLFDYLAAGNAAPILRPVIAAIALLVLMLGQYAFAMLARYENTLRGTLKNALLLSIGYFPRTLAMAVFAVILWLLAIQFLRYGAPILFLFGFSLPCYVTILLLQKVFDQLEKPRE